MTTFSDAYKMMFWQIHPELQDSGVIFYDQYVDILSQAKISEGNAADNAKALIGKTTQQQLKDGDITFWTHPISATVLWASSLAYTASGGLIGTSESGEEGAVKSIAKGSSIGIGIGVVLLAAFLIFGRGKK